MAQLAAVAFAVVTAAVVTVLEVEPGTLARETRLVEDLGADSLGLVEIAEVVEEQLRRRAPGFTIDDEDLEGLTTVGLAVDYAAARLEWLDRP